MWHSSDKVKKQVYIQMWELEEMTGPEIILQEL